MGAALQGRCRGTKWGVGERTTRTQTQCDPHPRPVRLALQLRNAYNSAGREGAGQDPVAAPAPQRPSVHRCAALPGQGAGVALVPRPGLLNITLPPPPPCTTPYLQLYLLSPPFSSAASPLPPPFLLGHSCCGSLAEHKRNTGDCCPLLRSLLHSLPLFQHTNRCNTVQSPRVKTIAVWSRHC